MITSYNEDASAAATEKLGKDEELYKDSEEEEEEEDDDDDDDDDEEEEEDEEGEGEDDEMIISAVVTRADRDEEAKKNAIDLSEVLIRAVTVSSLAVRCSSYDLSGVLADSAVHRLAHSGSLRWTRLRLPTLVPREFATVF